MWKKSFLFLSSLAVVCSLMSSLIGTSVGAVSDYDDVIQITPTLSIISSDGSQNISVAESGDLPWYQAFYDHCSGTYWANQLRELVEGTQTGRISVIQNDLDVIGVNQSRTVTVQFDNQTFPSGGYWNFYTNNSGGDLDGFKYVGLTNFNAYSYTLSVSNDGTISAQCGLNSNGQINYPVYEGSGYFYKNTFDVNYPAGYEGLEPPEEPVTIESTKLRPNIVIDVMNKSVSINSKINETVKAQVPDYKIYWFISNVSFDGEGASCTDPFSTSGYSIPSEPLDFEVPCLGTYSVNAYFSYANGEFPIDDFGGYQLEETTINVDINGGFFSIDTDNDFICDDNNFCQHESELWEDEVCDITHIGGCVNNVLHYLAVALGIDKTATNPTGSPFISFRTDTHGLLSIITAPLVAVNALTTASCSPISFTIPYINKAITLPCYYSIYQANLGAIFTLYQTIVTGVVAYFVIVGILRQVKEIKDPKKDQIEVVNL